MGISPDTTDVPIALAPLLVDRNVAVQPLPALADGAYTVGFRVLARDGHLYQGTFHFTVGGGATAPAAPAVASPRSDPAPARSWLVGGVAVGLTLPALATVVARMWRRRRSRTLAGTVTPSVDPSHLHDGCDGPNRRGAARTGCARRPRLTIRGDSRRDVRGTRATARSGERGLLLGPGNAGYCSFAAR
jgi:CopC domain